MFEKLKGRAVLAIVSSFLLLLASSCNEKEDPIETPDTSDDYAVPQLEYPAPENKAFQKIAYFPDYRDFSPTAIPDETLKRLDVACFAFVSIKSDFTVTLENPEMLQVLVNRCHKNGVKVLLSFNGTSTTYSLMTSRRSTRETFIKSVMSIVEKYNLDGVDNDWEYPSTANGSDYGNLYLMREFSNILHAPGKDKLLTMAITCGKYEGNYSNAIRSSLFDCVDWFNVMVYDDFSTTVQGKHHSPFSLMETAYQYWVEKRGLPLSKFVGGLPCYGRASGITQSGTAKSYSAILSQGGDPDEDEAVVSNSEYSSYTIYYNGRKTIQKKVAYCVEKGVGGYFFWEAGQDVHDERSLIKAAYDLWLAQ